MWACRRRVAPCRRMQNVWQVRNKKNSKKDVWLCCANDFAHCRAACCVHCCVCCRRAATPPHTGLQGVHLNVTTNAITGTLQAQALGRLLRIGTSIAAAADRLAPGCVPRAPCIHTEQQPQRCLLLHVGFTRLDVRCDNTCLLTGRWSCVLQVVAGSSQKVVVLCNAVVCCSTLFIEHDL